MTDKVEIDRLTFELMHLLLVHFKFKCCEARNADMFKRDEIIALLKKLQAQNEPEFFSTPTKSRERRLHKYVVW